MTLTKGNMRWYYIACLLVPVATICVVACVTTAPPFTVPATLTPASATQPPVTGLPTAGVSGAPTHSLVTKETTVTPGQGGIRGHGQAIHKSDVSTFPDSVMTDGEVLFIPEEHAADLAETPDFDPSKMNYMGHAYFQLDESQLAELDGAAAVIGADGRFPLDIPAGDYFVCLADIFVGHTAGPPYSVVGCQVIDLPSEASLTVSWGEGGVEATLD